MRLEAGWLALALSQLSVSELHFFRIDGFEQSTFIVICPQVAC